MFGTLKPSRAALDCGGRGRWQRFYCGTCQSLGEHFGLAYRGLLSHDAVFLALLVDGLQAEGAAGDRCRCPMVPVVHRATVRPDSVAMRYAAAVQMLLADQWAADRAIDGRSLARVARPLLAGPADRARATLRELGSGLGELVDFEQRQAATEVPGVTSPEEAAEPTAAALELVFERVAALPGVTGELGEGQGPPGAEHRCAASPRALLARLGRAVGTVIYLVDALDDLESDLRRGDFNPCLVHDYAGDLELSAGRVRRAMALLEAARDELARTLHALPLRRHGDLLANILVVQMGARAQLAVARARRVLAEAGERRRAAHAVRGAAGLLRFSQAVAALALTLFTTLWSRIVAAAQTGTGTGTGTDTGTDTGTTDTGTDTGADALAEAGTGTTGGPELGTTTGGPQLDEGGGSACPCCTWFGELINGCCGGMADACSGCGESLGACGGCFDGCNDFCASCGQSCGDACISCGDGCSGCNDVCGDCGNACSGCGECGNVCSGCGDCGNACSGCGDACSGCGDCGNACNGCGNCGGGGCNC